MSAHLKAQVYRFARVSALAFLAALATTGGKLSWSSLWALSAGALEAGLRELMPVKPIPAVSSVLAPAAEASYLPPAVDGDSAVRTRPGYGTPMQGTEVALGQTGVASNPPATGQPPGVQITPEG